MSEASFSVVIPTFNRAKFIGEAVASVLNQTLPPAEVIVIDDGSTDNTAEVMKQFGSRVIYCVQSNAGPSAARNTAIRQSRSEWVAFLDSDDAWEPTYLATQAAQIRRHPEAIAHMTNSVLIHPDGRQENIHQIFGLLDFFRGQPSMILPRPLCRVIRHTLTYFQPTVVRRETLLTAGLFPIDIRVREDLHLMSRLAMLGPFTIYHEPLVRMYRRTETTTNLSKLAKLKGIETQKDYVRILSGIMALPELDRNESLLLRTELSDNFRSLGNLHMRNGSFQEGRACFWHAVRTRASLKSTFKALVAYTPRPIWSLFDQQAKDVAP